MGRHSNDRRQNLFNPHGRRTAALRHSLFDITLLASTACLTDDGGGEVAASAVAAAVIVEVD